MIARSFARFLVGMMTEILASCVLLFALVVGVLPPRLAHEGMGARRRRRLVLQAGNCVVVIPAAGFLGGEVAALSARVSEPRGIPIRRAVLTF